MTARHKLTLPRSSVPPPAAATVPKDAAAEARRGGPQEGRPGGCRQQLLPPDWLLQAGEQRLAFGRAFGWLLFTQRAHMVCKEHSREQLWGLGGATQKGWLRSSRARNVGMAGEMPRLHAQCTLGAGPFCLLLSTGETCLGSGTRTAWRLGWEGERWAHTPSLAAESRCLERRREGSVDMGGSAGTKAARRSWRGDMWHVWADYGDKPIRGCSALHTCAMGWLRAPLKLFLPGQ